MQLPNERAEYRTNADGSGVKETGIYSRIVKPSPNQLLPMTNETADLLVNSLIRPNKGLDIDVLEEFAREIVKPYVTATPNSKRRKRPIEGLNLGDGDRLYEVKTDSPEFVIDAIEMLHKIRYLRIKRQNNNPLSVEPPVFEIGRLFERILVREVEPFVATEKNRRKKAAAGGRKTLKWTLEVERIARQIFAEERRLKVSLHAASVRTAARLLDEQHINVSARTVRNKLGNQ
jgi:hypothetical protein